MFISHFTDWDNGTNPEFVDLRVYIHRDDEDAEWEFTVTLYRDTGKISFDGVRYSESGEGMEQVDSNTVPADIMEAFKSVEPEMIAELEATPNRSLK